MKGDIAKRYIYFLSIRPQKDRLLLQIIILLSFYKRNIKCDFRTKSANLRKQRVERLDKKYYNSR